MTKETRPLSPHLSVYRWQVTNTLSIIHRLSGVALYFGSLLLPIWIFAVAFGGPFGDWIIFLITHNTPFFCCATHWSFVCILLSFIQWHKAPTVGYW